MSFTSDFDLMPSVSPLQAANRFNSYFDAYEASLKQQAGVGRSTITLIARSPASPPARALARNLGRFQSRPIEVKIIFAQIAPPDALSSFSQALSSACRGDPHAMIRWAENRALLDAHERLVLGQSLCWTGDSMRRSDDSRSAFDRVDSGASAILSEASSSFASLWRASKPLPRAVFCTGGLTTMDRSTQEPCYAGTMAPEPDMLPLGEYSRVRRH
jgi:hypothetical protein